MFSSEIEGPVAVIGDLHGQVDQLRAVREKLRNLPDIGDRWIVFIGDLVDRGPDPRGGVELVLEMMDEFKKVTCVAGNHDFGMAAAMGLLDTPSFANWAERWVDHYDSETTFASYGVPHGDMKGLISAVPEEHAMLLMIMPWCVEHPRYLFVHAGLDPYMTYESQVQALRRPDMSVSRPPWLCEPAFSEQGAPRDCVKTVVSGHVRFPEVQFRDRKILCDTTGGLSGELSCVLLPEKEVISSGIPRGAVPARKSASDAVKSSWWKRFT
jgi:serine/threonine protein phosphatase 1